LRLDVWLADLRTATMLLTRLPVGKGRLDGEPDLARALWAYPVVGAAVGALGGATLYAALAAGWPASVAAILAIGVQVLITGAFHEDGLGDVADGMGGGWTRARKLAIMRDSRLGTFGVVALVLMLALRIELLRAIAATPHLAVPDLVTVGALSRGTMVGMLAGLPPARSEGLGRLAGRPGFKVVVPALLLAAAPGLLLVGTWAGVAAILAVACAALALGLLARRQLGGHTGDVLGAGQQVAEIAALLALVLWRP